MAGEEIAPVVKGRSPHAAPTFEQVLETLIIIAQGRGHSFLAYLLIMALMHARDEDLGEIDLHS